MITVIDVMIEEGVEADASVSTSIGARCAAAYVKEYGHQPEKELRTKTSGVGSHCFALYPHSFKPVIRAVVRAFKLEATRQSDLFR